MDYEKMLSYFRGYDHSKGNAILAVSLVILIVSVCSVLLSPFLSILFFIATIVCLIWGFKELYAYPPITTAEYEEEIRKYIQSKNINKCAYSALGIDADEVAEAEPIYIEGYEFKNAMHLKQDYSDKLWRPDRYKVIALYFSNDEMMCYSWVFNTTIDKKEENTDVYFYDDIVSISTATETYTLYGISINQDVFKITTKGGTSHTVTIKNMDKVNRSINALRSLLREKKHK